MKWTESSNCIHEQSHEQARAILLCDEEGVASFITALRNFHSYLYGQDILLRTHNAAVSWMRSLKTPTGQVARWLQSVLTI